MGLGLTIARDVVTAHGGRIAFTDWVAHRSLSEADRKLMWQGMAVTGLFSLPACR
jgi:signal transduction histidine kinase